VGYERFITDNPCRLLNIGSAEPNSALRKRAEEAAMQQAIGLQTAVPLEQQFGATGIAEAAASVEDARTRCMMCLFWPFDNADISAVVHEGHLRLPLWLLQLMPGQYRAKALHFQVIRAYFDFAATGDSIAARRVLALFDALNANRTFAARMQSVIVRDYPHCDASHEVNAALGSARLHLLTRLCEAAAKRLRSGEIEACEAIAKLAISEFKENSSAEEALAPLIGLGSELITGVRRQYCELPIVVAPGSTPVLPADAAALRCISQLLHGRTRISDELAETVKQYNVAFFWAIRGEAERLYAETRNASRAMELIQMAMSFAEDSQQTHLLQQDLSFLQMKTGKSRKLDSPGQNIACAALFSFASVSFLYAVRTLGIWLCDLIIHTMKR
jgi:hypothetical protein